jgi:hypothetical protein
MYKSGHPMAQSWAAAYANARRHPKADGGGIQGFAAGGGTSSGNPGGASTNSAGLFGYGSQPNYGYSPQFAQLLGSMGYQGSPQLNNMTGVIPETGPKGSPVTNPFGTSNGGTPSFGGMGFSSTGYAPGAITPGNTNIAPTVQSFVPPVPAPAAASTTPADLSVINGTLITPVIPSDPGGSARGGTVKKHFQTGGSPMLGGPTGLTMPTTPTTASPIYQQNLQQFQSLSPQQLQQAVLMYGANSPRGQIAARVLQQKRLMPNAGQPAQLNPAAIPTGQGQARGGRARRYDVGGAVGYLDGNTPGRTDVLHIAPPGGSYVIPADVVAGLGEGNSIAGAAVLDRAFQIGPHNTPLTAGRRGPGVGIPKAAPTYGAFQREFYDALPTAKKGGATKHEKGIGVPTPIIAASGEYIVAPHIVRAIGGGDIKRGHEVLDAWILKKRQEVIDTMKKLKPPKK